MNQITIPRGVYFVRHGQKLEARFMLATRIKFVWHGQSGKAASASVSLTFRSLSIPLRDGKSSSFVCCAKAI